MTKLLICTDLDRTLIPNGPQPESMNARTYFTKLANRQEVVLAYVSGRDRKLVEQAIKLYCLPRPDYVIGDVGTTIYRLEPGGEWISIEDWQSRIARDWGDKDYSAVKDLLVDVSALRPQEVHKQNRFKLSYYLQVNENTELLGRIIDERLSNAGVRARKIWSIDEPAGVGLLDIIPLSASKRHAIEEIMMLQKFDLSNTVFCGDSGNDLEVLASPIKAVLVGNARSEIKTQAKKLAREQAAVDALYVAQGEFYGLNGNYSAGMLEGIAHYFPCTIDWIGLDQVRKT